MKYQGFLFLILTSSIFIESALACLQTNTTCGERQHQDGFRFLHNCSMDGDIFVTQNDTLIAYKLDTGTSECLHVGMRIDSSSFFMKECEGVKIKCTLKVGGYLKETCLDYKITEPTETPVSKDSKQGVIIGAVSAGLLVIGIIVILVVFHRCYSKCHEGSKVQMSSDPKLDNHNNNDTMIEMTEIQPAICPCDENERNGTLESIKVQSADSQAGETAQDLNLFSDEETKAKDGTSVPDAAHDSRDMQRNLRHKPGGVNDIKADGPVGIKEKQNVRTPGERGPKDDEKEREPLLPIQGTANQRLDMTGEDTVLVDKSCFDPNPVGRCSTALDADVESAHNMKNLE